MTGYPAQAYLFQTYGGKMETFWLVVFKEKSNNKLHPCMFKHKKDMIEAIKLYKEWDVIIEELRECG